MKEDCWLQDVDTTTKAEVLRRIRNECRKYMTRDTAYISMRKQVLWLQNLDRSKKYPFLLQLRFGGEVNYIGYGLIRLEEGITLLSGGLTVKYRRRGFGKILFELLLTEARKLAANPIELEVLGTNGRAKRLYEHLGFVVFRRDGYVLHMRFMR